MTMRPWCVSAVVLLAVTLAAPAQDKTVQQSQRPAQKVKKKAAPSRRGAVPLVVSGDTVVVVRSFPVKVTAGEGADLYFWEIPPGVVAAPDDDDDRVLNVKSAPKGVHSVRVTTMTFVFTDAKKAPDKVKERGVTELVVGDVPTPGPTPDPPPDPPTPDVKPFIDAPGFYVMVIYETGKKETLTRGQDAAINGDEFRSYLLRKSKSADGKNLWRLADPDATAEHDEPWVRTLLSRPRKEVPWVILGQGKQWYEGPLPKTYGEVIALVKKYGGE
jgi:hypothetical protein